MATKFITVSIDTMHDKKLSPNQKFILSEIYQLSSLEKGCFASNKHFATLIGITTQGVSKSINQLAKMGYIIIDNAQTKRNFGRVITINSGKSPINSGLESKENKTKNKTISEFDDFLSQLKKACKIKSKVTNTDEGKELFKSIENKEQLFKDYLLHQEEKGSFSVRITSYMLDYKTVHAIKKDKELTDEEFWGGDQC